MGSLSALGEGKRGLKLLSVGSLRTWLQTQGPVKIYLVAKERPVGKEIKGT